VKTVRLTRHDTGTDLAINPDNVIALMPGLADGAPLVGVSGLLLPGGAVVAVSGDCGDIAASFGADFVQVAPRGAYVNRRNVLLVEPGMDPQGRTILGVAVIALLGTREPLIVSSSVGEVAQALELGGGKQDQRSRLVVVQ
jgi:hypothetical protein